MSRLSIQQLRGLQDLIQEAIEAGANEIEEVHQAIARQPFALLERIDAIAVPIKAIEHVQRSVISSVYHAIRAVNQIAGILATQMLDRLEEQGETPNDTHNRTQKAERSADFCGPCLCACYAIVDLRYLFVY